MHTSCGVHIRICSCIFSYTYMHTGLNFPAHIMNLRVVAALSTGHGTACAVYSVEDGFYRIDNLVSNTMLEDQVWMHVCVCVCVCVCLLYAQYMQGCIESKKILKYYVGWSGARPVGVHVYVCVCVCVCCVYSTANA
jgi:hypothetical protein